MKNIDEVWAMKVVSSLQTTLIELFVSVTLKIQAEFVLGFAVISVLWAMF